MRTIDRPSAANRLDFESKVAIVTGGTRGIGLAIARALTRAGATVVVTSRTEEGAQSAAAELGSNAVGIMAHAADETQAQRCVEDTIARFGRIDLLVNNAGTNAAYGPVIEQAHAAFHKTIEVNLWAPILWTSLVVRAGMGRAGGSVLNVASLGGLQIGANLGIYNASKAALIHLTRQLALELAPSIRVNAVAPGTVPTRLSQALFAGDEERMAAAFPVGRLGSVDDVAESALFLLSPAASWITGEVLTIDGGQSLRCADTSFFPSSARDSGQQELGPSVVNQA